jgi:hypothetical protein
MTMRSGPPPLAPAPVLAFAVALAIVVSAFGASCDGGAAPPPPSTIESCKPGWQPLTSPRPFVAPRNLAAHGNELIYEVAGDASSGFQSQIEAQAMTGGAPRVVATAQVWSLWVEGDQVYYASNTTLGHVPVAGGATSEMLLGPPVTPNAPVFGHLLTPADFIWWQLVYGNGGAPSHNEIWAAARAGGDPRLVASVETDGLFEGFVLADDTVLAAGEDSQAWAVPVAGGAPRGLTASGIRFAGLEKDGAYGYDIDQPYDPAFEKYSMHRSPVDGGAAVRFWPALPARVVPDHIWADGDGGWLVSALEIFDDALAHRSIFLLDASEKATRVACDPSTIAGDLVSVRPVFTPDSAYFIDENVADPPHATWRLMQVSRAH